MFWHRHRLKNFLLLLDWKVSKRSDNSGVFLRVPDPSGNPRGAQSSAYQIQINDTGSSRQRTGSIQYFKAPTSVPTKSPGQWNHYEIHAVGQTYSVWINGKKVNEFTGNRSLQGHLGLEAQRSGSTVSYRDVRVIELP